MPVRTSDRLHTGVDFLRDDGLDAAKSCPSQREGFPCIDTNPLPPNASEVALKNPLVREFQIPAAYSFPVW